MRLEGALRGIRSLLLPENRDGERALHENIFENQGRREGGRGDWGIQRQGFAPVQYRSHGLVLIEQKGEDRLRDTVS